MSGICGVVDFGAGFRGKNLSGLMGRMQQAMIHRGFERESFWVNEQDQVALSDCHLLSSRSAVLSDETQHIKIAYDGDALEHHGHPPALAELARVFADPSRSPVDALRSIDTPFALALWNDRLKKLLLARDAFDFKPLYFASGRGWLAFASELRALRVVPGFDAELDREAIKDFLSHGVVSEPRSMHRGARKVRAGGFVELDCAPLLASASLVSIRQGDPAASGVVTMLAPLPGELRSSHFLDAHPGSFAPGDTPIHSNLNLANLTPTEQTEMLRRAMLESLELARVRSDCAHVMRTNTPIDALIAAMIRLELGMQTHWCEAGDPLVSSDTSLSTDIARHLGVVIHQGQPLHDLPELLNRVSSALDEPIGSIGSLAMNSNAAITRENSSHAICGVGGMFQECPALRFECPLLNHISAHHSLAVTTPLLHHKVRLIASAPAASHARGIPSWFGARTLLGPFRTKGSSILSNLLARYFPQPLCQRILRADQREINLHAEKDLAALVDSMLFANDSRMCQFANRIELRGLLSNPSDTPLERAQGRWSLLVLESWLRRQTG